MFDTLIGAVLFVGIGGLFIRKVMSIPKIKRGKDEKIHDKRLLKLMNGTIYV